MTFDELLTAVKTDGGFDVADATVKGWINQRYRDLVTQAKWRLAELELFTTVAGTAAYTPAADVVDVEGILVADGTEYLPYRRIGARDIWRLKTGDMQITGSGGAFAPAYGADGTFQIQLWPVPQTTGMVVTGLCALQPADLVGGSDTPGVPSDFHDSIRDGAIGVGLRLIDERIAEAQTYDAEFQQAVGRLMARRNSRVGSGATQAKVAGYHVP